MNILDTKVTAPQRADHVGSFLRPSALKEARKQFEEGKISAEELKNIRRDAIKQLVKKQKEAGLRIISDGEYNRTYWHLDFMWGFEGVGHSKGGGVPFHGEMAALDKTFLIGRIKPLTQSHPFIDDFGFLRQFEEEGIAAKLTVPSPAQFFQQFLIPQNFLETRRFYPTNEELIADVAAAYQSFIKQFYSAGGRILQFDDCTWGAIVGDAADNKGTASGGEQQSHREPPIRLNDYDTYLQRKLSLNLLYERPLRLGCRLCLCSRECRCSVSGIRRRAFGQLRGSEEGKREQKSGSGTDNDEKCRTGRPRNDNLSHSRSIKIHSAGASVFVASMRLCIVRDRKQTYRRRAMGKDCIGSGYCP